MTIHLYAIAWNEETVLPFFFRHYDHWVDRYVIYDDGSTDRTAAILHAHPKVHARPFRRTHSSSFELSKNAVVNADWKESRGAADLVVLVDIDEYLHHPDLIEYVRDRHAAGVTAFPALGYQMVSETFPAPDEDLVRTRPWGASFDEMNKLRLLDPNAIEDTNFDIGQHTAALTGRVVYPDRDEILLLHYKYLGFDYVHARECELAARLGRIDRHNLWGHQYFRRAQERAEVWAELERRRVDLSDPGFDPERSHFWPRWWRDRSPSEKIARLRRGIDHEPRCADYHRLLGIQLLESGEAAGAEDAFRSAIRLRPHAAELHVLLGDSLQRQGRLEAAVDAVGHAVRFSPHLDALHHRLGTLLCATRRFGEAAEAYRAALSLDPDNALNHFGLSRALAYASRLDEAAAAGERAVALAPRQPEVRGHLAGVLDRLAGRCLANGETEAARAALQRAVALVPGNASLHVRLSELLVRMQRPGEAVSSIERAIALLPARAPLRAQLEQMARSVRAAAGCRDDHAPGDG